MDDLISRQAAIDALRAMQTYKLFAGDDMLLIDQAGAQTELMMLPPAQPEPHWHPVNEQPQEDDDYLLLTHEKTKYGTFKRIIIGAWNGATKEWLEEYEGMYRDVNHPVAWISKEELLLLKGWR